MFPCARNLYGNQEYVSKLCWGIKGNANKNQILYYNNIIIMCVESRKTESNRRITLYRNEILFIQILTVVVGVGVFVFFVFLKIKMKKKTINQNSSTPRIINLPVSERNRPFALESTVSSSRLPILYVVDSRRGTRSLCNYLAVEACNNHRRELKWN